MRRTTIAITLLLMGGCYASHERDALRSDAGVLSDAHVVIDAGFNDAGADAGSCGQVDAILAEDIYRLARARDGSETHLVVGHFTPRVGPMSVEVWDAPFARDGTPSIVPRFTIPGSVGAQPVVAALRGGRLALALDQGESPDELLVIELASNTIVARRELDETLRAGFGAYAWLALDDAQHLLSSVDMPAGGTRVRVYDIDASAPGGLVMRVDLVSDVPYEVTAAFASVDRDPLVRLVLEGSVGAASVAAFPRDAGALVDVDGSSIFVVHGQEARLDGRLIGTLEAGTSSIYGYPTLAVLPGTNARVVALTTDHGLRWDDADLGTAIHWSAPSTAFLAGNALAHVDASNRGIFFIEPAFGSDPARLRYVGHCVP